MANSNAVVGTSMEDDIATTKCDEVDYDGVEED
jgi:hypothetical protein